MGNHLFVIFAVLDVSRAVNSCINHSFFTFIVSMAVSLAISEIFSVKEYDLTLISGFGVVQGHWKWRCSIDNV